MKVKVIVYALQIGGKDWHVNKEGKQIERTYRQGDMFVIPDEALDKMALTVDEDGNEKIIELTPEQKLSMMFGNSVMMIVDHITAPLTKQSPQPKEQPSQPKEQSEDKVLNGVTKIDKLNTFVRGIKPGK